jgi:ribosomal protein L11 methyltransferase
MDHEDRPGDWVLVRVPAPPRGQELLLVEALRALGARQVEREAETVAALFPAPADEETLRMQVRWAVQGSTSLAEVEPVLSPAGPEAWQRQWRVEFTPRRITSRLLVVSAEAPGDPPEEVGGEIVIRIAAGLGFGTAGHPTTRSCLRSLDRLVQPGDRVADIGTGSGILAVAAALLGAWRVLAVEKDGTACAQAAANIRGNGVERRVRLRQAEVGPRGLGWLARYDGVVANLDAPTAVALLPALRRALTRRGWLVLSGIGSPERDGVVRAAACHGLLLRTEETEEGWWTGELARGVPTGPMTP